MEELLSNVRSELSTAITGYLVKHQVDRGGAPSACPTVAITHEELTAGVD
ncbi:MULTISPECIES: hypothetical protein [unclassified Mesorhizobium]|nr:MULTISPECIES: hypothetical protein [unclassified Mesorhizobium]